MLYPPPYVTEVKARAISRAVAYDVARRRHNERALHDTAGDAGDSPMADAAPGEAATNTAREPAAVGPPRAYMPADVAAVPLFALGEGRVQAILARLSAIDAELSFL